MYFSVKTIALYFPRVDRFDLIDKERVVN